MPSEKDVHLNAKKRKIKMINIQNDENKQKFIPNTSVSLPKNDNIKKSTSEKATSNAGLLSLKHDTTNLIRQPSRIVLSQTNPEMSLPTGSSLFTYKPATEILPVLNASPLNCKIPQTPTEKTRIVSNIDFAAPTGFIPMNKSTDAESGVSVIDIQQLLANGQQFYQVDSNISQVVQDVYGLDINMHEKPLLVDADNIEPNTLDQFGHNSNDIEDEQEVLNDTEEEQNEQIRENQDVMPTQHTLKNLLEYEETRHDADKCCSGCRTVLLNALRKLDEVLLILKNPVHNKNFIKTGEKVFDQLTMLPVTSKEELSSFDSRLVEPTNKYMKLQFEEKIASVGGHDCQKNICNILAQIMTDECAQSCTWIIKKPEKIKIYNYNFVDIIIKYIVQHHNVSNDYVRKRIQLWLQKCGDRIKAKTDRAARETDIE